jgi:hypothetical protein
VGEADAEGKARVERQRRRERLLGEYRRMPWIGGDDGGADFDSGDAAACDGQRGSSSRSRLSACGVCDSVRDIPIRIWISVPPMFTMTAMPGYWISIG